MKSDQEFEESLQDLRETVSGCKGLLKEMLAKLQGIEQEGLKNKVHPMEQDVQEEECVEDAFLEKDMDDSKIFEANPIEYDLQEEKLIESDHQEVQDLNTVDVLANQQKEFMKPCIDESTELAKLQGVSEVTISNGKVKFALVNIGGVLYEMCDPVQPDGDEDSQENNLTLVHFKSQGELTLENWLLSKERNTFPDKSIVGVIGSGPSGLCGAGFIVGYNKDVLILERHDFSLASTHLFEIKDTKLDYGPSLLSGCQSRDPRANHIVQVFNALSSIEFLQDFEMHEGFDVVYEWKKLLDEVFPLYIATMTLLPISSRAERHVPFLLKSFICMGSPRIVNTKFSRCDIPLGKVEYKTLFAMITYIIWGWYYKEMDIFLGGLRNDYRIASSQNSQSCVHPGCWRIDWRIAWM